MARLAIISLLLAVVASEASAPPRRLGLEQASLRAAAPAPAAAGAPGGAPGEPKGTPALAGKMPLKAAEQGFEGSKVKHEDQKTVTHDWGAEYGPHGPQPMHKEAPRSSSFGLQASVTTVFLTAVCHMTL